MEIIMTPEQKALREKEARLSPQGQVEAYSRAFGRALDNVNEDLVREGANPFMQAAISALSLAQAHLIAQVPDRGQRRQLVRQAEEELKAGIRAMPGRGDG